MMEKKHFLNYQREAISIIVYTLNQVQVKNGTNKTPFELWYGYVCTEKYFKVFGRKCYLLKDSRHGKLGAKSDEGIILGYSTKRKVYKCLNFNINKIMESANIRVDEFVEKNEEECKNELEDYRNFVYIYEGEPSTLHELEKVIVKHQQIGTFESQQRSYTQHQQATEHQVIGVKLQREETEHQTEELKL